MLNIKEIYIYMDIKPAFLDMDCSVAVVVVAVVAVAVIVVYFVDYGAGDLKSRGNSCFLAH